MSRIDAHQKLVGVQEEDKAQQAMDAVVEAQGVEEKAKRSFRETSSRVQGLIVLSRRKQTILRI